MPTINNFASGCNTKIQPTLIPNNACQYVENAIINTGRLESIKKFTAYDKATNSKPMIFKNNVICHDRYSTYAIVAQYLFVGQKDKLIQVTKDGKTYIDIGIKAPTEPLSVKTNKTNPNEIPVNTTQNAIDSLCYNAYCRIKTSLSAQYSHKESEWGWSACKFVDVEVKHDIMLTQTVKLDLASFTTQQINDLMNGKSVSISKSVSASDSHDTGFKTTTLTITVTRLNEIEVVESDKKQAAYTIPTAQYSETGYEYNANLTITTLANPQLTEWGNVYGQDLRWCYTYYNKDLDTESAPSPFTPPQQVGEFVSGTNSYWKGSYAQLGNIVKSDDPQVTNIRVYRLGHTITQFQLVAELDNRNYNIETFTDNVEHAMLGRGIRTLGYSLPPKCNFITVAFGQLFGVFTDEDSNHQLRWSNSDSLFMWSSLNYVNFEEPIVGCAPIQIGMLVFTENRTYMMVGTDPSQFTKQILYPTIGCIHHGSIQQFEGVVIWQDKSGIYVHSGQVTNITINKLNNNDISRITDSCVIDRIYYGLQDNGKVICIDFNNDQAISYLDAADMHSVSNLNNELVYCDGKNLLKAQGDLNTLKYKSKWYADNGIFMYKNYKTLYVYSIGKLKMKVYIDNRLVADANLKDGINEVKVDQTNRTGYYIWFEFEGQGIVYEVNFVAEPRQNGR